LQLDRQRRLHSIYITPFGGTSRAHVLEHPFVNWSTCHFPAQDTLIQTF
jgi:hypothetical protein